MNAPHKPNRRLPIVGQDNSLLDDIDAEIARFEAEEKERLGLDSCAALTSLPSGVGALAALRELRVTSATNLTELPDLSGLVELRELTLSGCGICDVCRQP